MKKPKVFENKIDKQIMNNQNVYDSNQESSFKVIENKEDDSYEKLSVIEKIDKLLNRKGYIFNVDVVIKTNEREYKTKIAGKINNHLITLDNDIIKINDIIDLKIKE